MKNISFILILLFAMIAVHAQTWERVVPLGILGDSTNPPSMALDSAGTPYLAFEDNTNSRKVTVKRLSDNNWETVGNAGFSPEDVVTVQIVIHPDGTPYVIFPDSKNDY